MPYRLHGKYASQAQYRQYYVDHPDENPSRPVSPDQMAPESSSPQSPQDTNTLLASILARLEAIESRDQTSNSSSSTSGTTPAPFGGPLTSNPAAGESVESQFPTIAPEVLQQIREHSFKPQDLYKLDPLARDSERTKLKVIDDTLVSTTDRSTKEYPTFQSLARPLSIYFSILLAYAHQSRNAQLPSLMRNTFRYNAQLVTLYSEYQWSSVLVFHHEYMLERISEMRTGDYSGWKDRGADLRADYLDGHRLPKEEKKSKEHKASPQPSSSASQAARLAANANQICMKFNQGTCAAHCPQGRRHACSNCLSTAHGARQCAQNAQRST